MVIPVDSLESAGARALVIMAAGFKGWQPALELVVAPSPLPPRVSVERPFPGFCGGAYRGCPAWEECLRGRLTQGNGAYDAAAQAPWSALEAHLGGGLRLGCKQG